MTCLAARRAHRAAGRPPRAPGETGETKAPPYARQRVRGRMTIQPKEGEVIITDIYVEVV